MKNLIPFIFLGLACNFLILSFFEPWFYMAVGICSVIGIGLFLVINDKLNELNELELEELYLDEEDHY